MAAITPTYSIDLANSANAGALGTNHRVTVVLGNGVDTYSTGGIALNKASLGCPNVVNRIELIDNGAADGLVVKIDFANLKVLLYQADGFTPAGSVAAPIFTGSALAAHRHNLHLNDAEVADGATTRVNAGTNLLSTNTGSDILVAGVANTSGAGGIVDASAGTPAGTNSAPAFTGDAVAAAALAELGASDTPEVTIVLSVTGY